MVFIWKVTLLDGSIVTEEDQLFELGWEVAGAITKFELIDTDNKTTYSVDLNTGIFEGPDSSEVPPNILPGLDKELFFRRRNKVTIAPVVYIFGYIYKDKKYVVELSNNESLTRWD